MRTTVIERFDAEREQAYDPDYHELLTPELSIEVMFGEADASSLEVKYEFEVTFYSPEERPVGSIEIVARADLTEISDLPIDEDGEVIVEDLPENVLRLIEGALAEDILIPASSLSRAMKLPSLLPIPRIFRREEGEAVQVRPEG